MTHGRLGGNCRNGPLPGSRVYYDFPEPSVHYDEDGNAWKQYLCLQKFKGEWRILYGASPINHSQGQESKPITDCSAEIRVEAVKYLPGLREAVIESAENFIEEVDSAIQQRTEQTA